MMDDADYPAIIAQIANRPRRLVTAKQWRAAIVNRQIDRDTMIEIERGPGVSQRVRAGDCEELQPMLAEVLGAAPEPSPAPAAAPDPEPVPRPEPDDRDDLVQDLGPPNGTQAFHAESETRDGRGGRASDPTPFDPGGVAEPVERVPPIAAPQRSVERGPLIFAGLVIAAILVAGAFQLGGAGNHSRDPAPEVQTETSAPEATPTPASAPNIPTESYHAIAAVAVRMAPDAGAKAIAELPRDALIEGVRAENNADWLQITQGSQAGGFVMLSALSTEARPALDASTADDYFTTRAGTIYGKPDESSNTLTTLSPGTKQTVTGSVGDFAEVTTKDGGAGYVPWRVFGGVGGMGERHPLVIENHCSDRKLVAFSLIVDGQRTSYKGYGIYAPNSTGPLLVNADTQVYVNGTELYYADLGVDFAGEVSQQDKDHILANGKTRDMKRIVPILDDDGNYRVTFCS